MVAVACSPSTGPAGSGDVAPHDVAREERLFEHLQRLTAFGHRHYGAARREEALERLVDDLAPYVATVELQRFSAVEAISGVRYDMVNVIARTAPDATRRVLFGTHWDTRLWADEDPNPARREEPVPGANDGTSGVVVLTELLRSLAGETDLGDLGIDVALFDGEELGRGGAEDAYCQGSKRFAGEVSRFYPQALPIAAVVVDMVGDRDLAFRREANSSRRAPELTRRTWELGRARFPAVFLDRDGPPIFDDHVPLQAAGIPSVLWIDLDYPPWHTVADTPEACSGRSLAIVADFLRDVVRSLVTDGVSVVGAKAA